MISIDIPVKPHVKKFLLKRYGKNYVVSVQDTLGRLIIALLNKKSEFAQTEILKTLPEKFSIYIPENLIYRKGIFLTNENLLTIGNACDDYFREFLYSYVLINAAFNQKKYKSALQDVLDVYKICEDDIAMDTLLKDFQRKRNILPFANLDKERLFA